MISRWLVLAIALFFFLTDAPAERILSDQASAALWTVGPGQELYAAFGHSALRITDPVIGFDRIYNFGTFDFATPNFYLKFIKGDLDYYLTAAIAPEVLEEYRADHQLVVEQQLDLTIREIDELFLAMEDNLQPERAAYRYDFVRDNCTTRIRDAVAKVVKVQWKPLENNAPTLRQMVQPYVADRPAIKTGINLLFGANMDHRASTQEAMFLPEDMKTAFDNAILHDEVGERKLVKSTTILLDGPKLPVPAINWLVLATYVAALIALISVIQNKWWPHWLDVTLFCLTALIGCFIAFVWFGTRHWVLHNNWNLLWAWPTHLIIWFFPRRIQEKYWKFYLVFFFIFILVQDLVLRGSFTKFETLVESATFAGIILLLLFRSIAQLIRSSPSQV